MADRVIDENLEEAPEIPEALENVLLFALNECKENLLNPEDDEENPRPEEVPVLDGSIPFTVLCVKNNLFIETHPGDSPEAVYAQARHTVEGARGATAYALCYDGYVETDDGTKDAIIAEGGLPGEDEGYAVGYIYTKLGEIVMFQGEPCYIGAAPNFMAGLKDAECYDDEDIDDRYLVDDAGEDTEAADACGCGCCGCEE